MDREIISQSLDASLMLVLRLTEAAQGSQYYHKVLVYSGEQLISQVDSRASMVNTNQLDLFRSTREVT